MTVPAQVYVAALSAAVAAAFTLALRWLLRRSRTPAPFSLPLAFGATWGFLVVVGLVFTLLPSALLPFALSAGLIVPGGSGLLRGRMIGSRMPARLAYLERARMVLAGFMVVAGVVLLVLTLTGQVRA